MDTFGYIFVEFHFQTLVTKKERLINMASRDGNILLTLPQQAPQALQAQQAPQAPT